MNLPTFGAVVAFALALVVGGIILSSPIDHVDEVQIYYTQEPLTYEASHIRDGQVSRWIWWEATEAQYMIKNTDAVDGNFTLNFVFSNEKETKTTTEKIKILAGTQEVAKGTSTFNGVSKVTLYVVPPLKSVRHERIVTKDITGWDRIWDLLWIFGK